MTLAEAPLVVMLVGLVAYAVLAGADFGAGFWQMLPGRGARERAIRDACPGGDHAGLGGQPRLADPRADGLLDLLPGRLRLDRLDALQSRSRSRRSGSSCARSATSLRGQSASLRDRAADRGAVRALVRHHAVRARRRGRRHRLGPGAPRQRPRRPDHQLARTRPRSPSACSPSRPPRTSPPSGSSADAARLGPRRPRGRLPHAGDRRGDRRRGDRRRGARRRPRGRRSSSGTSSRASPAVAAVIVSAAAGTAALALLAARLLEPARAVSVVAVAAVIAGWALAQRPEILPGLTVSEAAAGRSTLIAVLVGLAVGALILVPSLVVLFRMVLRGTFDAAAVDAPLAQPAAGRAPPNDAGRRPPCLAVIVAARSSCSSATRPGRSRSGLRSCSSRAVSASCSSHARSRTRRAGHSEARRMASGGRAIVPQASRLERPRR